MNDTDLPPGDGPTGPTTEDTTRDENGRDENGRDEDGFDAQRLRSVTDMRRSSDPRMVAGVCAGLARHLNIDPILVRIVFAVLIFVGGAGIILYGAFWFLLPADDTGVSIADDWFRLGDKEEKVRVGGLILAGIVALLSVIGGGGWGRNSWGQNSWGQNSWGWGTPWGLVLLALIVYFWVVRPRRRLEARAARAAALQTPIHDSVADGVRTTTYTLPPERRSWALTVFIVSVTAIAIAVVRIIADSNGGTPWTTYVALALAIVGLGLLISTVVGDGGPLVLLGLLLAVVLGLGTLLPNPRLGAQQLTPTSAVSVSSAYEHGVGLLELDLTDVDDPDALLGRTITLDSGVGQTKVVVPNGLNVAVAADLNVGELVVFDRTVNGTNNQINTPADPGRALTLTINQKIGNIEVIRQ
jgi:phage shock protein PspC (stress-responsive transcriptional regulator)